MTQQVDPEVFTLDLIGDNGTPFRFMFWPKTGDVKYYDRRYPAQPDEPHYRLNHYDENGQNCGPGFVADDFPLSSSHGIRGWHEVDAWDIDRGTRSLVGQWIHRVLESRSWA